MAIAFRQWRESSRVRVVFKLVSLALWLRCPPACSGATQPASQLLGGLFRGLVEAGLEDAYLWVLSSNPSRFFYEAMGGERAAERQEAFAGTLLDETAYGWPDLTAWLGTREIP